MDSVTSLHYFIWSVLLTVFCRLIKNPFGRITVRVVSISIFKFSSFNRNHQCLTCMNIYLQIRFRLISDVTFTRKSTTNYIIHKLNRIMVILNNMLDCFDILNLSYTKYMFIIMVGSMTPGMLYAYGKFRLHFFCALQIYFTKKWS